MAPPPAPSWRPVRPPWPSRRGVPRRSHRVGWFLLRPSAAPSRASTSGQRPGRHGQDAQSYSQPRKKCVLWISGQFVARDRQAAAAVALGGRNWYAGRESVIARQSVEQPGFRSRPCVARPRPFGTPANEWSLANREGRLEDAGADDRAGERASETGNVICNCAQSQARVVVENAPPPPAPSGGPQGTATARGEPRPLTLFKKGEVLLAACAAAH